MFSHSPTRCRGKSFRLDPNGFIIPVSPRCLPVAILETYCVIAYQMAKHECEEAASRALQVEPVAA